MVHKRHQRHNKALDDQSTVTMELGPEGDDGDIWYFGVGPIVHPQVRMRREIETEMEQPAVLDDHMLTFVYGGIATVIPRRGFQTHGVLMKLKDREAWKKLKAFDAGAYEPEEVDVYAYKQDEYDEGNLEEFYSSRQPVTCYVFVQAEYDESVLEKNVIDKKPQERYLRLIANGMRQYHVYDVYIDDEIMVVPFIDSRKEEDWYTFPYAKKTPPKITLEGYKRMCQKKPNDLFFILGDKVIKLDERPESGNSAAGWLRSHGHGKEDLTHLVHQMIVDPYLPYAKTEEEMTEKHFRWVENHMFDFMQLGNMKGHVVFTLRQGRPRRSLSDSFSQLMCFQKAREGLES
mmetsp:Transcript_15715/g.34403  ORF Transcript_15715/g.34403 Transcript_15715/m.34403 type:complete len:346 (-) Transcript_15715:158-1195(-)|eukprot:CAMPEP_0168742198 /NCGR_PEP_ID=MMETSP0724-20121128/12911_1 /TAXON_ID=265536 /ORGANISM="Amphiprora sp., Strain CCMP467" /LENGTH=345 /DNA_ID=CAMNT_0008789737 /DNA_START=222 /DNA_END=1259 /DNA_ORIENTATION=+